MKFKLLIICFFLAQLIFSQIKNEKEARIQISEFPEKAQNIIKVLPQNCKHLKFYKETDGEKHSFEAKFKYKKQRYSLEFSTNGIIEDIEITTKFKDILNPFKDSIKAYFKNNFKKYKFIKIQKQYSYSQKTDSKQFLFDIMSQNTKTAPNFEIIAEVKTDKDRIIKEFTFNNDGSFISARILNPTSYEHVLY